MEKLRKSHIILVGIILTAAFLRLYRIGDYLRFLGDEGRDVQIVKHLLEGHLVFIGPRASAGDFFTGPAYYYMMAPFLWLSRLDPVGPAIMIALLGIATVYLIYRFGKEFFNEEAALFAAALYAVSPTVVDFSRSSWNPNPMPFFTLLILYLLLKAVQKHSLKLFFLIGILYGITLQLHYIELFVGVMLFFFILVATVLRERVGKLMVLLKRYLVLFFGFLLGMAPFLAFEVYHRFPNTKTIIHFIVVGDPKSASTVTTPFFITVGQVGFRLFGELLFNFPDPKEVSKLPESLYLLGTGAIILSIILSIFFLFRIKDTFVRLLFGFWLFFGVVLFGFYHKPIFVYYFEFMFPLPFFLFGNVLSQLYHSKKFSLIGKVLALIIFLIVGYINISHSQILYAPNKQKEQVESIDRFVLSKTDNKPFNFALIAPGNSDQGYRYYFEILHQTPVTIDNAANDPKRKTVTDQLMVVCEDITCKPLGNPLFDVAGFGRAEIAGEWDYSVVKVYKLKHYSGPQGN